MRYGKNIWPNNIAVFDNVYSLQVEMPRFTSGVTPANLVMLGMAASPYTVTSRG